MTAGDLREIESALGVTIPGEFRAFLLEHGDELDAARKTLADQVVLGTRPAAVIKLNRGLRKQGVVLGDDRDPSPWPLEYLALTDNGGGDYECVKLTEAGGAIHRFLSESSRFERLFPSPTAYLADLRERVAKHHKAIKARQSSTVLRAPQIVSNGQVARVEALDVESPVSAAALRAAGVDTGVLCSHFEKFLAAVTGIAPRSWTVRAVPKDRHVHLEYATAARSNKLFAFTSFQVINARLGMQVMARDPARAMDVGWVDWPALDATLAGMCATVLRTPVRLQPGKPKATKPERSGYATYQCGYQLLRG